MTINMEVNTIDHRMKALGKKYRELGRASTAVIWSEGGDTLKQLELYNS